MISSNLLTSFNFFLNVLSDFNSFTVAKVQKIQETTSPPAESKFRAGGLAINYVEPSEAVYLIRSLPVISAG